MLTFADQDFRDSIAEEVGVRPAWSSEAFADLESDVRQNISRITSSAFIPKKDFVRGFIFDVASGLLREVL